MELLWQAVRKWGIPRNPTVLHSYHFSRESENDNHPLDTLDTRGCPIFSQSHSSLAVPVISGFLWLDVTTVVGVISQLMGGITMIRWSQKHPHCTRFSDQSSSHFVIQIHSQETYPAADSKKSSYYYLEHPRIQISEGILHRYSFRFIICLRLFKKVTEYYYQGLSWFIYLYF